MTTLYEGAFAKLNLTLDVLDKRPDGYHDLKSVMQTISIRDDIQIDLDTGKPWELICSKEGIPTDERNLAWKAAKVYCEAMKKDPDGITVAHARGVLRQKECRVTSVFYTCIFAYEKNSQMLCL